MKKQLTVQQRLIVAADFKPDETGRQGAYCSVIGLAEQLQGSGVTIKVNSILRAFGYELIEQLHACGLRVFADLKLYDIGETLATDGALLREFKPELLTVCCDAGVDAMSRLKDMLPDTEVLGITVLTSLTNEDLRAQGQTIEEKALANAFLAKAAGIDGLICSPKEVYALRTMFGDTFTHNCPGVRFASQQVAGDDQNQDRVATPAGAIRAGADRIVMGRPIVQADNPLDAVKQALDDISSALI